MVIESILIFIGFVLLIKGADVLVDGACSIAKRHNISDLVVGLTIVAFGTSAPELAVSTISSFKGNSEIALGNVLGSNIANLCLVLGVCGVIAPIAIKKGTVWREIPFCLAIAVMLLCVVMVNNVPFTISREEAVILIAGLAAYVLFMFRTAKESPTGPIDQRLRRPIIAAGMVFTGLVALLFGGLLIVRNCINIAEQLGVSETMMAVTIVALGTSLPELAVSVAAVLKGKPEIAVGNVVGSNILNTCLVLGVAATIRPLATVNSFTLDAQIAAMASLMLFLFMFTGKKRKLDRWEAMLFLVVYAGYIGYAIYRR